MRNRWIVLLIATLTAGCASASTLSFPDENQGKRAQEILVGTWNGYVTHSRERIDYNTPTLQIFRVERTNGGWAINLSWNGKRVDAELTVNNTMVMVEFIELYANLLIHHSLVLYGERRMVGKIWYGTRTYTPAEVILEKIY